MEVLVHGCSKRPTGAMMQQVERDETGEWWVKEVQFFGGIIPRSTVKKIQHLTDGICPWCKGNIALIAKLWPHNCPKPGQGALRAITNASIEPTNTKLEIDGQNPSQATYTVTFKLNVTTCPDCGAELFKE